MNDLFKLNYTERFLNLPESLYSHVKPQGLEEPIMVCSSAETAALLDLDVQQLESPDALKLFSGNALLSNWQPIAMKYTGHQFGYYNPDLGDGRGLLLAEVKNENGQIWDLHLKGAGLTPYSRQGDGRAVLRSSIREFLCSEALAALDIPTTRALCILNSKTPVYREQVETGATLVRVAETHIRFGHFEFCSFTGQTDLLKTLCHHVIDEHYPEFKEANSPYLSLFEATLKKTATLMAKWQSIGFCHGVMNTDNMSILGDTFDFGPFAFLDDFDPSFICNHSDHQGRYAFDQQPNIANWNLAVLAQAFLPLADKASLLKILETYSDCFKQAYHQEMKEKLGLGSLNISDESANTLINSTLQLLSKNKLDYTRFFREIIHIQDESVRENIRNQCIDIRAFDDWLEQYSNITDIDYLNSPLRIEQMQQKNPKYILRNYLAQNAIEKAQSGDYSEVKKLHQILKNPFDEQPEFEEYSNLPPDWGKELEISCSS